MEKAIAPALAELEKEEMCYWVPPHMRFQKAVVRGQEVLGRCRTIYACLDENEQGLVTIDTRIGAELRVRVKEMVFPGDAGDDEEIEDKWIYVFRDHELVAYAHAICPDKWLCTSVGSDDSPIEETNGYIRLDPGPKGDYYSYAFFLSPVRLSQNAIDYLTKDPAYTAAVVRPTVTQLCQMVSVPDPFRWAADTSRLYLVPLLAKYHEWVFDEHRQARLLIASTLKHWIGEDDEADIRDELEEGEPESWLEEYAFAEQLLRKDAEKAAAYLAHCVDSYELYAVEMACMDQGGDALALCFQAWAAIAEGMIDTHPGRSLAARIVANPKRFVRRYLFSEQRADNSLEFRQNRYLYRLAASLYKNLLPAMAVYLKSKDLPLKQRVIGYIEMFDLSDVLGTKAYNNFLAGRELTHGLSPAETSKARNAYQFIMDDIDSLVDEAKALNLEEFGIPYDGYRPPKAVEWGHSLQKIHKNYRRHFIGLQATVGSVLEITNLCLALDKIFDADEDKQGPKILTFAGTAADLTAHALGILETLATKVVLRRWLSATGGAIAGFASAVDMYDFAKDAYRAEVAGQNYLVVVGYKTAMVGSGLIITACAMAVAKALCASLSFGPWLPIIFVVAAALVAIGVLIAAMLADPPQEVFARLSFLRSEEELEGNNRPEWSPFRLPSGNILEERNALLYLLANFRLKGWLGLRGEGMLIILPGLLNRNSVFDISIRKRYANHLDRRAFVQVHLENDRIVQTDGLPLEPRHFIKRDENNIVTEIGICLKIDGLPEHACDFPYKKWEIRVRLQLEPGKKYIPYYSENVLSRDGVKVDTGEHGTLLKLPSSDVVSSFDGESRCDWRKVLDG